MYLTGVRNPAVDRHLDDGTLGLLNTPNSNYAVRPGWWTACDNGAFNERTYVGDEKWFAWLSKQPTEQCLFATAPDVVGDHVATMARSLPWLQRIRDLGFPVAFVLQDGATVTNVPWDAFEVAFVGGTNDFKLGGADELIREAIRRGKRVHVGRVNSGKRFERFAQMGVDTADGTFIAFHPSKNLQHVLSWVRKHATQAPLFAHEERG